MLHPSFVQSSAHLALGASWRCNPERVPAAAAAAAMVSPVTVVSARAREPAAKPPRAWDKAAASRAAEGGGGSCCPLRGSGGCHGPLLLTRVAPLLRAPPCLPAGGRKTLCT